METILLDVWLIKNVNSNKIPGMQESRYRKDGILKSDTRPIVSSTPASKSEALRTASECSRSNSMKGL